MSVDADERARAQHQRLMAHFDRLCDLPAPQRAEALEALGQQDPALVDALRPLLAADESEGFGVNLLDSGGGLAALARSHHSVDVVEAAPMDTDRLLGQVVGGRYTLDALLGSGGGGAVFRAKGRDGQLCAIKVLHPRLLAVPRYVRRFRREFRAVSRLEHPGCLRVFEEGQHGEHRFIAMEYAPAGDLNRLIGADLDVIARTLAQVAVALDYVHRHRVVHRDIKPANILLFEGEPYQPKLADFGIVKLLGDEVSSMTDAGSLIGTIDYLSPEQASGGAIDPRSDIYSLGCVLHVLLAGRPPFDGTVVNRLTARLTRPAPSLAERAHGLPLPLVSLVDAMLETRPERRPQSASAVAQVLASLADGPGRQQPWTFAPGASTGGFLYEPGIVGQAAFVDELFQCLSSVGDGEPPLHLVFGPAGFGKTTLAQETVDRLERKGWQAMVIRTPPDGLTPFAPFPELIQSLGEQPISEVVATGRAFSEQAEPSGRRVVQAMADGVVRGLNERAGGGPLVLFIEDLHFASSGALDVLAAIPAALAGPVAIVATARPPARVDLVERVGASGRAHDVPPLSSDGLRELAGAMLGTAADAVPPELLARVSEVAGGSPLLIRSAIRGFVGVGALRRGPDGWFTAFDEESQDLGNVVARLLDRRLRNLRDDSRRIARVAAALGERFELDVLVEVIGDEDATMDALDDGLRQAVFSVVDRRREHYRFEHARLRDALYDELDPSERARTHDQLAAVLEARPETPLSVVAHHVGRGSDDTRAREYLVRAADEAADAYDFASAAQLQKEAIARCPDGTAEHSRLLERLADLLVILSRVPEADPILEKLAAEPSLPKVVRARRLRKRGMALMRGENTMLGMELLNRALAVLGDRMPAARWRRYLYVAGELVLIGLNKLLPFKRDDEPLRTERAMVHRELALLNRWRNLVASTAHLSTFARLTQRLKATEFHVDVDAMSLMLTAFLALPRLSRWFAARAARLATDTGDELGLLRVQIWRGGAGVLLGFPEQAAAASMDEGVAMAERIGDQHLMCFAIGSRGWAKSIRSLFQEAYDDFARAEQLARSSGAASWMGVDAGCGRAIVALVMGRFDESRAYFLELSASDARVTFPVFEALSLEVSGAVAFMECRFLDAISYLDRAEAAYRNHDLADGWGFLIQLEQMESLLSLVDESGLEAVPDLLPRLRRAARGSMRFMGRLPVYAGCDLLVRGVVASRAGRPARARRLLDRALEARPEPRRGYMDTWIRSRRALELYRMGDPPAAITEELDTVDAIYQELGLEGLRPWLRRVRELNGV